MRCSLNSLVGRADDAAENHIDNISTCPLLSVTIFCVGRRLVLGQRADEEREAVHDPLPKGTQPIGFYSYGQLSLLAAGQCRLHNQTMTYPDGYQVNYLYYAGSGLLLKVVGNSDSREYARLGTKKEWGHLCFYALPWWTGENSLVPVLDERKETSKRSI